MAQKVEVAGLRVALFSGNYNYVKDGANQALNRLAGRLIRRGAIVRVYSPVSRTPAFPPTGELVAVPSFPILFFGRGEYRLAVGLPRKQRRNLEAFRPDIVHLAAPDILGHAAKKWALRHGVPAVASVHTRFETYGDYYGLGFLRPGVERALRRFYAGLREIYAPSPDMVEILREGGFAERILIWSRGVDHHIFRSQARSLSWRQGLGIGDDEVVIGFVGRLVLEKGLDVVADIVQALAQQNVAARLVVVGDGPARKWLEERVPGAIFTGFLTGAALARAYASFDIFLNPSVTEAFGNVTLEAMASGVPAVAARATGSNSLVVDGETGRLVPPRDIPAFVAALADYAQDAGLRHRHGAAAERRSAAYDWDAINDMVIDRYAAILS